MPRFVSFKERLAEIMIQTCESLLRLDPEQKFILTRLAQPPYSIDRVLAFVFFSRYFGNLKYQGQHPCTFTPIVCRDINPAAINRLLTELPDEKQKSISLLLFRVMAQIADVFGCYQAGVRSGHSGESHIHRIWLGADPGEDNITQMLAANCKVWQRWKNKKPGGRQYIWTDNKRLLQGGYKLFSCQARDYSELLFLSSDDPRYLKNMSIFCLNLISAKRYAHATNILRLLCLLRYGGLYLDFTVFDAESLPNPVLGKSLTQLKHAVVFQPDRDSFLVSTVASAKNEEKQYRIDNFLAYSSVMDLISSKAVDLKVWNLYAENFCLYAGSTCHPEVEFALKHAEQAVNPVFGRQLKFSLTNQQFFYEKTMLDNGFNLHDILDTSPLVFSLLKQNKIKMEAFLMTLSEDFGCDLSNESRLLADIGVSSLYINLELSSLGESFKFLFNSDIKSLAYSRVLGLNKQSNMSWEIEKTKKIRPHEI
ncbi:glycosyltransferase [Pelagibaculum spongiae]|uniref:Uncharacterized protein n=1 Tax=Pelagibaculum spongiae TaxID=2080658 RepID=A0A2V1GY61_9GAMM|nr:glycosyltransferase [Pelagibaculum spongiae]PVZ72051.1 hypothetical protein DC094_03255 [Pelagibaculum spongiae]